VSVGEAGGLRPLDCDRLIQSHATPHNVYYVKLYPYPKPRARSPTPLPVRLAGLACPYSRRPSKLNDLWSTGWSFEASGCRGLKTRLSCSGRTIDGTRRTHASLAGFTLWATRVAATATARSAFRCESNVVRDPRTGP